MDSASVLFLILLQIFTAVYLSNAKPTRINAYDYSVAQKAILTTLRNPQNNTVSVKDVISISRLNREYKELVRNEVGLWQYVETLGEEPCYSSFAENAYYVPAGRRNASSQQRDSQDKIRYTFNSWDWAHQRLDGTWWDGNRLHLWQPFFATHENVVTCVARVLDAGLRIELVAEETPANFEFPLGDGYQTKLDSTSAMKQWLLWIAVAKNVSTVVDYLLSPQMGPQISSRHLQIAAATRNQAVYEKLVSMQEDLITPWDRFRWADVLQYFEPTTTTIEQLIHLTEIHAYDFRDAAHFGRTNVLKILIDKALEEGITDQILQRLLDMAYLGAVQNCQVKVMDMILTEYQIELDAIEKRQSFMCAIKSGDIPRTMQYLTQFRIGEDFRRWVFYLSQDETPSRHVKAFVSRGFNLTDEQSLTWIVKEMSNWPVQDTETFRFVDLLLQDKDDGDELEPYEQKAITLVELGRGNLRRAKRYLEQFELLKILPKFQYWVADLRPSEIGDFLDISGFKVTRQDVLSLFDGLNDMREHFAFLIENIDYWTSEDLNTFDTLTEEFSPETKNHLRALISRRRYMLRLKSRKRLRGYETM